MEDRHSNKTRRWFVGTALGGGAAIAATSFWRFRNMPSESSIDPEPGKQVLANYPSVDVHSHPGRSFLVNAEFDSAAINAMQHGFEAARVQDMRAGNVTASLFAIVADIKVLDLSPTKGIVAMREFEPGEAFADFERQLAHFADLAEAGVLTFADSADSVVAAHRENRSVAVLSSEGAEFVENKLERLSWSYDAGLRSITLVHYRPSEYGDIQTAPPLHGGLTALGAELVKEMNRLGIIVDVAHASFETALGVADVSSAPIMLSHSHLSNDLSNHPRLLSPEHAKLIANQGGVIGSWPAGITSQTMSDFIDETFRLIDLVGIDHVSIGTDLDANYRPVLTDYGQFPEFVSMLLRRGLSDEEAGKVIGTNFLRLFDEVSAARQA